ncbi:MAG: DNA-binding protein [Myxococcales bacterium]|nr:DNA-binding protein [Myxococcales bacterium]MCL4750583.1 DNA-binding protein [Myxococcales bacterium]
MKDFERVIRARVEVFVAEISELVRRAALDAVADALGEKPSAAPKRRAKTAKAPKPAGRGSKRSATELESLSDGILRFVAEHPGSGAAQIAAALKVSTKDLVLPMKKLGASGALFSKGQKRATKYFRGKK